MDLKSKTINVIGEKKTLDGVYQSTLPGQVDKALDLVFDTIRGSVVNVVSKVDFVSNQALITVLYKPAVAIANAVSAVKDIKKNKGGNE